MLCACAPRPTSLGTACSPDGADSGSESPMSRESASTASNRSRLTSRPTEGTSSPSMRRNCRCLLFPSLRCCSYADHRNGGSGEQPTRTLGSSSVPARMDGTSRSRIRGTLGRSSSPSSTPSLSSSSSSSLLSEDRPPLLMPPMPPSSPASSASWIAVCTLAACLTPFEARLLSTCCSLGESASTCHDT